MRKILLSSLALAAFVSLNSQTSFAQGVGTANDATFSQAVLASPTPVVVDFYADWCGPCRSMGPAVEDLAAKFGSNVKFVRVNIDASPQTANQYGINSIPAFRVFKNGKIVGGVTGAVPEQSLSSVIKIAIR